MFPAMNSRSIQVGRESQSHFHLAPQSLYEHRLRGSQRVIRLGDGLLKLRGLCADLQYSGGGNPLVREKR